MKAEAPSRVGDSETRGMIAQRILSVKNYLVVILMMDRKVTEILQVVWLEGVAGGAEFE